MLTGARRVVPGSSANSFVYLRLTSNEFGMQMPPTGSLRADQIETIRAWIEQGAEWPDNQSNEAELPPIDPKAVALVEALRTGDMKRFNRTVAVDPKLLNARGPQGSTPFMYAVRYCGIPMLRQLLKHGADPNRRNDVGATALLWTAHDLEKTRLLVEHGADVNARSNDLRTPLMVGARQYGAAPIVKFLLDHGANPNPNGNPVGESSPLVEAATTGDFEIMKLLIDRGANVKAAGQPALTMAVTIRCAQCLQLLMAGGPERAALTGSLSEIAALGDVNAVRTMLDHGADVNAFDPFGRTPLMYAAISDLLPLDVVQLLIERGADVNAVNRHKQAGDTGWTVLDIAKAHGATPVVELLVKAGARGSANHEPVVARRQENTIQEAVKRSIPLLQRTDAEFLPKAACTSCHNDSLPAIAVAMARRSGFQVDEKIAVQQVKANFSWLEKMTPNLQQGFLFPVADYFSGDFLGYSLVGLGEENHPPGLVTDTVATYLKTRQRPNGEWAFGAADTRPPLCSHYIGQTALAMRALQFYAPKTGRPADYEKAIQLAASWLANAKPASNTDRSWRLLGLAWAGKDKRAAEVAVRELLAVQKPDGGWADIPSMDSTAFATGQALVALRTAGLPVSDAAFERGTRYLLQTQQEDGSWHVRTRALAFQPYFEAGFPHGFDQWISAAATSWATMALSLASPQSGHSTFRGLKQATLRRSFR
jgi:ankyrin repeat protein